jgi:hypothetical protein
VGGGVGGERSNYPKYEMRSNTLRPQLKTVPVYGSYRLRIDYTCTHTRIQHTLFHTFRQSAINPPSYEHIKWISSRP